MRNQCMPILNVIFVLSTIVSVTDCCSSRILLLRQQTLQIEERVVQLVNQMELQQQLNADGQATIDDIFADAARMLQVASALDMEGELAAFATTEQDGTIDSGPRANTKEAIGTTDPTPTLTELSTTTITPTTTTNTMATGEPPPSESTTELPIDVSITEQNEALPTTTTTTTTTTETTTTTITTTVAAATASPAPGTTNGSSAPKVTEETSFRLPCSKDYLEFFCLNGGHCFRWANANSFSYCVCAVGYVGERCDSKTENGVYVQMRPTTAEPQLKTAHIVFSFPMLVLLSTIYVLFGAVFMLRTVSAQRRKQHELHLHKQRFFISC